MASSKSKFAWADVAVGAIVAIAILLVFYMQWADALELKLYDMRAKMRAKSTVTENIILVGIDDQSIREIGRWPWPRAYVAEMVDQLSEAGAKVIGVDVFFSDQELNPGLAESRNLKKSTAN